MTTQPDGHKFELTLKNPLLSATWTRQRSLMPIDVESPIVEPSLCDTESALVITLDPCVVESNPVITIVVGDRTFRAVEIRDLPAGLFGEHIG